MSVKCIHTQTPLLYIKTGVCKGLQFFLFSIQNIGCGYSLEPPRRGGFNVYPQSMFCANNIKNIKILLTEFSIFTAEKLYVNCMGKCLEYINHWCLEKYRYVHFIKLLIECSDGYPHSMFRSKNRKHVK